MKPYIYGAVIGLICCLYCDYTQYQLYSGSAEIVSVTKDGTMDKALVKFKDHHYTIDLPSASLYEKGMQVEVTPTDLNKTFVTFIVLMPIMLITALLAPAIMAYY